MTSINLFFKIYIHSPSSPLFIPSQIILSHFQEQLGPQLSHRGRLSISELCPILAGQQEDRGAAHKA